jgi:hypothetical protein
LLLVERFWVEKFQMQKVSGIGFDPSFCNELMNELGW